MKKILPFFSYLFHPIFIPLFGTLFYLLFNGSYFPMTHNYLLILQIIIITFFLPLAFFYLLRTFGKADTIMLSDIHQRKIPLLMQMALTSILITKSVTVDRFPELFFFFLGGFISTFFTFILLFIKVKASIHMIGISALTFFVVGMSMHNQVNIIYTIASLFLLNGIIASSRLQMKAHTMEELVIGMAVGTLPQLVLWIFWL
ncbi:hypothetical protein [Flavobacterium sp.]|uniref:hypothetical protein n=1 Tax=Flavobacterium sp. TaxID=239 RepID=UPI00263810A3|nr:hypothetical protein [Flavobacterium sp.]